MEREVAVGGARCAVKCRKIRWELMGAMHLRRYACVAWDLAWPQSLRASLQGRFCASSSWSRATLNFHNREGLGVGNARQGSMQCKIRY
jgi:hypothetical protein